MKSAYHRSREGANVRRLRIKAGISQENLARQIGVTTHTVWRLENDPAVNPRLQTLRGVAKALGVTMAELLDK